MTARQELRAARLWGVGSLVAGCAGVLLLYGGIANATLWLITSGEIARWQVILASWVGALLCAWGTRLALRTRRLHLDRLAAHQIAS